MLRIDDAARAAVIGSPIAHSKSPLLHAAAYALLGIDCPYIALDVTAESLRDVVSRVRGIPGWRGLSVTMPLKAAAVPLADDVTGLVTLLGVANTLAFGRDGLVAHNTDVAGIARALGHARTERAERAVVLGGGGTAAAAVAGLASLAMDRVDVLVRRPEAAADLVRIGAALGLEVRILAWDEAVERVRLADVVVSTLPPRGADSLAAGLAAVPSFRTGGTLLDVAYDPWPSSLAAAWSSAGGTVVAGLEMLLHQAVEQVRLFVPEVEQDPELVLGAMRAALPTTPH